MYKYQTLMLATNTELKNSLKKTCQASPPAS